eukprot:15456343-Alexandrium_andersonii.AAC.1
MPWALPPEVAGLFPPLLASTITRVGRVLQAKVHVLFARPELDAASFSLTELAFDMDLGPLTVVRAVFHSRFDRSGRLRFLVVYRHDELCVDVLRFPVE